jgi:hypothetical protein
MSVEFTLTGCALDEAGWDALLEAWAADRALLTEPQLVRGHAHLLAPGSIRGVVLARRDDGAVDVRLSALASRTDWRLAYSLVRQALARGGGTFTHEEGHTLGPDALTDAAADAGAIRDFAFAAGAAASAGGGQEVLLPVGAFSLAVAPGELPAALTEAEVPAVEERLAARVARYAGAFHAATLVLGVEGKQVRLSTWARIPTLVAAKADLVAVQGIEDPIPREALLEVLGPRAERTGDHVYLPGLDDAEDGELLGKLRGASVSVEAFVEAHRDRLEADTPSDAPGGAAGFQADVRRAARAVAECLVGGGDPKDARRDLLRDGMNKDTVDAVFAAAGVLLQIIQEAGGFNERAGAAILASEVPAFVRDAVLGELAGVLEARRRARAPARAMACLVLVGLVILAIGGVVFGVKWLVG